MNNLIYLMDLDQNVCKQAGPVLGLVGIVIFVLRVAVPVLLVVLGTLEMFKAISSDEADAISKAGGKLGKKVVAAILVFLIPTIVGLVMNVVNFDEEWKDCKTCLGLTRMTDPFTVPDCKIK